jgi:hypothetical protein
MADALTWVAGASKPVSALRDLDTVRRVLDAISTRLDKAPAAATTIYRKRAVFYNALGYAVERKLLPANPIDLVQWTAPEIAEASTGASWRVPNWWVDSSRRCGVRAVEATTWRRSSAASTTPACVRPKRSRSVADPASSRSPGGVGST